MLKYQLGENSMWHEFKSYDNGLPVLIDLQEVVAVTRNVSNELTILYLNNSNFNVTDDFDTVVSLVRKAST